MANPIKKASTVQEAQWACELTPLPAGDSRWVDFKKIRGEDVQRRFRSLLIKPQIAKGAFSHITFAGHRGSGKSTELLQLSAMLEANRFFVVYCQANEELDIADIEYSDLLLAASKVLVEKVGQKFSLNEALLSQLTDWFAEVTDIKIEEVKKDIQLQASAEAGVNIPFLARFLGRVTALLKGTQDHRTEIRKKVLKSPDQLIFSVNQIIDECHLAITKGGSYEELLLIFDNLDRYPPETVRKVLVDQADNLKRLRCNIIYTVPISLIYDPRGTALPDVFKSVVLPMIKIREKGQGWGQTYEEGISSLVEVINRRVEIDQVFSRSALVKRIASQSGGSLRELMRLVQEACIETVGDKIDDVAIEKAIIKVRSELTRHMPHTYFAELASIHKNRDTDNTPEHRSILFYRYALEYNGDRWVDVHPLIYDLPDFKRELQRLSGGKKTTKKKIKKRR